MSGPEQVLPTLEPLLKRAISIREKNQGADHVDMAPELAKLANLYVAQQKWPEAEPTYQKSIAILEKENGPNHYSLVPVIESLAGAYKEQEKFDKAEPLYLRALAIRESTFGPSHPELPGPSIIWPLCMRSKNASRTRPLSTSARCRSGRLRSVPNISW